MPQSIDYKDLYKEAQNVTSWTGVRGEASFKIAAIVREYRKPHKGIWKDNC